MAPSPSAARRSRTSAAASRSTRRCRPSTGPASTGAETLRERGMPEPTLSVVIPVYNRERELHRAIGSCLAQQGASYEVVVVDDASTDGSAAVAAAYAGRGVRLLRQPTNL